MEEEESNGLEAFGLTIPAVAIALSKLPGIEWISEYEGPEVEEESVSVAENLPFVLQAQWHPACRGYWMREGSGEGDGVKEELIEGSVKEYPQGSTNEYPQGSGMKEDPEGSTKGYSNIEGSIEGSTIIDESLKDSLKDSLKESLKESPNDSLKESLKDSLNDSTKDSLKDSLIESLKDPTIESTKESTNNSPNISPKSPHTQDKPLPPSLDPRVTSPIFFGFTRQETPVCAVCGLPATTTHPFEPFSVTDVPRALHELRDGHEPALSPREMITHRSCKRVVLWRLQEMVKKWKPVLEKSAFWSLDR